MAIIGGTLLPEIDRPKYGLAAVQCARIRSTRIDGRRLWPTDHPLSLSRGTWPILGRIDYYPNREIFTDASIDSFFFFSSRSSRSNDPRSRVVSKWLIGCPSSEVFHRFVSRENDEDSRGMERGISRSFRARSISRFLRIVLIIFFENTRRIDEFIKIWLLQIQFFLLFFFWIYIVSRWRNKSLIFGLFVYGISSR